MRTNIDQLIGGATEETIVARVGEGIVSAIGSAETHAEVLQHPDLISKAVLKRKLDRQTAYEIVSIDIAKAIADSFRQGKLAIMDYYRLQNVQADSDMRSEIAAACDRKSVSGKPAGA